jgi:FlaA1/EpsC-like NDP-sugar epimerase
MTIPEAAQLVIQAGAMATGGDVFVLDMGEPVKIADLARMMVKLSGLTVRDGENPSGDIEIRMIGMRPGEKLYEELLIGDDPQPTRHPRIMRANEPFLRWQRLQAELARLADAIERDRTDDLLAMLRTLVPGYQREAGSGDDAERDLAS